MPQAPQAGPVELAAESSCGAGFLIVIDVTLNNSTSSQARLGLKLKSGNCVYFCKQNKLIIVLSTLTMRSDIFSKLFSINLRTNFVEVNICDINFDKNIQFRRNIEKFEILVMK